MNVPNLVILGIFLKSEKNRQTIAIKCYINNAKKKKLKHDTKCSHEKAINTSETGTKFIGG